MITVLVAEGFDKAFVKKEIKEDLSEVSSILSTDGKDHVIEIRGTTLNDKSGYLLINLKDKTNIGPYVMIKGTSDEKGNISNVASIEEDVSKFMIDEKKTVNNLQAASSDEEKIIQFIQGKRADILGVINSSRGGLIDALVGRVLYIKNSPPMVVDKIDTNDTGDVLDWNLTIRSSESSESISFMRLIKLISLGVVTFSSKEEKKPSEEKESTEKEENK